jgi:hypothetical protein
LSKLCRARDERWKGGTRCWPECQPRAARQCVHGYVAEDDAAASSSNDERELQEDWSLNEKKFACFGNVKSVDFSVALLGCFLPLHREDGKQHALEY